MVKETHNNLDFTASFCGKPAFFKDTDGSRKFHRCSFEAENLKEKECSVDELGIIG